MHLEKWTAPNRGVKKWVKLEEVRPVAIGREELKLPRDGAGEYDLLDTVAYDWGEEVHLGMILSADKEEGTFVLHVLEPKQCKADITFVLNWTGGPGGKPDRRMEHCPEGYVADVRAVECTAVHGRVLLMGNYKLTEEARRFLDSLGVDPLHNGK